MWICIFCFFSYFRMFLFQFCIFLFLQICTVLLVFFSPLTIYLSLVSVLVLTFFFIHIFFPHFCFHIFFTFFSFTFFSHFFDIFFRSFVHWTAAQTFHPRFWGSMSHRKERWIAVTPSLICGKFSPRGMAFGHLIFFQKSTVSWRKFATPAHTHRNLSRHIHWGPPRACRCAAGAHGHLQRFISQGSGLVPRCVARADHWVRAVNPNPIWHPVCVWETFSAGTLLLYYRQGSTPVIIIYNIYVYYT